MEKPERGVLTGDVPLLPIQRWFFEKGLNNIHYFNQSALLDVKRNITFQAVKSIFNVIVQYHDAFRIRFRMENGQYIQSYTENLFVDVEERILNSVDEEEFHKDATAIHASLNVFSGSIFKVVVYRCPDGKTRILVVVHHLVIDGVSWRILLDDMETIYNAFMQTGRITLPAKTHSYRQWGNALMEYAKAEKCREEISYWKGIESSLKEISLIPDADGKTGKSEDFIISLSEKETLDLIRGTMKKYDAQINDILLTALTLAIGDVSGKYEFSFTLEGHGREDVVGLDVSRTIGWFTSIFPVFLKITEPKDLVGSLNEVKTTLRMIPNKGIGYSIIRYYTSELRESLPRISFNYLGQFDTGISDEGIFQYAKESSGENWDQKNESYNLIDMNCAIRNSVFSMDFSYKVDSYKSETIHRLASQFKKRLIDIIRN